MGGAVYQSLQLIGREPIGIDYGYIYIFGETMGQSVGFA